MLVLGIDPGSEEPVYMQIARQIRDAIARGALAPGIVLPAVRGIAGDLGVNLNTVARAYRVLEEEGFVRIRDRAGAEVLEPAARPARDRVTPLRRDLRHLLARLLQAGVDAADLRRMLESELAALAGRNRG